MHHTRAHLYDVHVCFTSAEQIIDSGCTFRQWSKKYPICLIKCDECDILNRDDLSNTAEELAPSKSDKDFSQPRLPVCLTTAKYAKRSTSNDSLEFLSEAPKVEKKLSKADYHEDLDKSCSDERPKKKSGL